MNTKKIIFFIYLLFIVLNVVDLWTATHVGEAETNPLFLLTKSFFIIGFFKLLIIAMFAYVFFIPNKISDNLTKHKVQHFILISALVYMCLILSVGVLSNIMAMKNTKVMEEASSINTTEKLTYYSSVVTIFYLLPVILNTFCFWLWKGYDDRSV